MRLQTELWLPNSLEDIWEFHKDPRNLAMISPAFMALSLEGLSEPIGKGSQFTIRSNNKLLSPFFNWAVVYEDFLEEPDYKMFVDTQSSGPFKSWRHQHEFRRGLGEIKNNEKSFKPKLRGTWIKDSIEYSLRPQFSAFGFAAEKLLTQLFVYRKRSLLKRFPKLSEESDPASMPSVQ